LAKALSLFNVLAEEGLSHFTLKRDGLSSFNGMLLFINSPKIKLTDI
jgi:hypothetical protein